MLHAVIPVFKTFCKITVCQVQNFSFLVSTYGWNFHGKGGPPLLVKNCHRQENWSLALKFYEAFYPIFWYRMNIGYALVRLV